MNLPYSNSTTDRLLGCLIQHPTLCLEDKYKLDKSEFKINKFHQILCIFQNPQKPLSRNLKTH